MDFFISNVKSILNNPAQSNSISLFLWLIIFAIIFYFLILRPQQKRTKEHQKLMDSIKKEDEVLTNGGLIGRVTKVYENRGYVKITLNETIEVIIKRDYITAILPKNTIKSL